MLQSYIRSAFRALLNNTVPSVINIVGLSIALASSIVVYLFLQVYYTLDTFHEHGDRIFMVEHVVTRGDAGQTWGTTPLPLGPTLEADLPQVERAVRVAWRGGDVRTSDDTFAERIGFADAGFFDLFTFPLQAGTPASLATPGTVILSEAAARTYFGDEDPLGQRLTITIADGGAQAFLVGGVAAPFPRNAGFRFDVLLPFEALPLHAVQADDWAASVDATFLLLHHPEDLHAVAAQMDRYVARRNAANPDAPVERFVFENLKQPAPDGYTVLQRPTEAPHPAFSLIMVMMAAFMMALSCFNYVNISLGSGARRLREIGVRKVLGGTKRQLVVQFMAENLLLCTLALILGIVIAWLFLVPLFNGLFVMQIQLSLTENLNLWAFLAGLLAFVGIASGAYPAFYVSSFQPVLIFQSKHRLAEKRWFTRSLITVQFIIVFLAAIATIVLLMNGRYILGLPWGYDQEDLLVVRLSDPSQFEFLRDAATGQASVLRVAGSQDHVGVSMRRTRFTVGLEEESEAIELTIGPGYAEAIGLRLQSGRLFDEHLRTDVTGVVVNQRFVQAREWTDPLGRTLRIGRQVYTVIGVVEDYLYNPVVRPEPTLLRLSETGYRFLTVRVAPGSLEATKALLETHWKRHVPELPFESFVQADVFDAPYRSYMSLGRGIGYLAALALLIACMGVFGLASQNIARRRKEVSIRKVLGASVAHVVFLVNRVFLVILSIAALVATALGYVGLRILTGLDAANVMPLTPVPFVAAYLLVLLTVAVSVASQSRTLALTNPADTLRRD